MLEALASLDLLAIALQDYNRDNSSYPASLDSLVPKYINEIPELSVLSTSTDKSGFQYRVLSAPDTQPFELKFESGLVWVDSTLYYFSIPDFNQYRPERSLEVWDRYEHKEVFRENWVMCGE